MNMLRLITMAVLAATLTVTACGKKGDPVRPGTEQQEESDS